MPKNKVRTKTATGAVIHSRACSKFRIGTRKSGKSAVLMSNEAWLAVLANEGQRRYFAKAGAVLKLRGVTAEHPRRPVKADPLANVL